MNWSDGANFYLLKCVKAYGKDWKLVSSALSVIINTFLRDDNGQDFSDKSCSIQYKYLIASTRQVEGQLDFFKEDDLLHLALLTYGHRRQEQIKLARDQLVSQINSKRSDNRKLLASRFSEITPESILVYRKRLRAFNLPDVISASLHLEPLPSNSEEDRETRRYLRYDDLAENGLRQATIDPDNGLWIPVCSEKIVRTFFDSRHNSLFADDTDDNEIEFDEIEAMEDLSPPSLPHKLPKLELPQSTETTSARRSSSTAVKKSLSAVTPNLNSVKSSSPLPYLNAPLFGAMEDSGGFHSSDILRPPLKRTSTIKAEHHPPLRTPVRPRNRSHTSVDIYPAPSHSTAGTHLAPRRRWRRGLLSALTTVCSHRHAHIFLHPVTDEIAPGYSNMVYAPVDLTTLRRRVEAGLAPLTATVSITFSSGNGSGSSPVEENVRAAQEVVASIAKQMLRDLLLMFANARMYNNREHGVHRMAGEMCSDVLAELRPLWMLWTDDIPGLPPLPGSPTTPSGVSSMLRRRNVVTSLPVLTATANRSNPPSTLSPSLHPQMAITLKTVTSADIVEKEREGKVYDVSDRAVWCLSSCKNNHGINELLNESLDSYWQSDGPQPHTVTVQFSQKTVISEICLYNDYKVDESYTPSRIAIRVGNHVGDLVELTEVELHEPSGWSVLPLRWPNGAPVSLFTLQLRILANHQNGRDTHLRAIRLFAPLVRSGLDAALNQSIFTTPDTHFYTTIR